MTTINLPAPKHTLDNQDIINLLDKNKLNFKVGRVQTPNPINPDQPTGFYTAYREDTGYCFQQGLTKNWHAIQNEDIFKCLTELAKVTDTKLMDIRSFKNGAEVAAQISLGDEFVNGTSDKISNMLSVVFAHNGTRALSLFMTPLRWGCSNAINPSFRAAQKENKKTKKALLTIQHSQRADSRLDELIRTVSIAHGEFSHSMDLFRTLKDTKIDKDLLNHLISEFFPIDVEATPLMKKNHFSKIKDISNRFNYADGGLQPVDSAWNLYNSMQGHLQHYTTRSDNKITDSKYKSVLIGTHETTSAYMLRRIVQMSLGNAILKEHELAI
jgi:hypothetical protein